MKFNFNELFLKQINEILDTREKALKEHIKVNYTHIDDLSRLISLEETVENLECIISDSEIEYRDFEDYVEKNEVEEILDHEIETRNLVSSSDLEKAFENCDLSCRIEDLDSLTSSQDYEVRKNKQRIETLEQENAVLKDRVLHIENFILKIFNKERFIE